MGAYGCSYDYVGESHKFVKEDGSFEEITSEYVIIYITGSFNRETYIDAPTKEEAIKKFKKTVGDYKIQSCELSYED